MKNTLISLSIIAAFVLAISSCKKTSNKQYVAPNTITLAQPTWNGTTVTLTWSMPGEDTVYYLVDRVQDTTTNPNIYTTFYPGAKTQYVDTPPTQAYVQYYVVAMTPHGSYTSNKVYFTRSDYSFMSFSPYHTVFDSTSQLLYLAGATHSGVNVIAVYDLQRNKVDTIFSPGISIGLFDIGTYNGVRELYIPANDSSLHIYNANTLALIDKISTAKYAGAVICHNGILYTSGSGVCAYNRSTKTLVSSILGNENVTLGLVPGTNCNFFGVSGGYDSAYFYLKYDGNGNLLYYKTTTAANSFGGPPLVSPDGTYFIDNGIISDSLVESGFPTGGTIGPFCFDATGQLLYALSGYENIGVYNTSTFALTKTISTKGNPISAFVYNGSLFTTSVTYAPYGATTTFIEKF